MIRLKIDQLATPTAACLAIFFQVLVLSFATFHVLEIESLNSAFFSQQSTIKLMEILGGSTRLLPGRVVFEPSLLPVVALVVLISACLPIIPTLIGKLRGQRVRYAEMALRYALWVIPVLVWCLLWILGSELEHLGIFAAATVNILIGAMLAGWVYETLKCCQSAPSQQGNESKRSSLLILGAMIFLYCLVFVSLNWGLWFNLQIPHGDSVMYEEHLWNLTHGKGFRSYLDQGLFLGEHIQVIHLFLIPFYLIWSSHLLLELSESLALALGAIPVYLLTRQSSGKDSVALFVAAAYLLSFPLHYLDIAIDLKTFRPISFGVPLVLWGIYEMQNLRWKRMTVAFILALLAKEDFAIILGPLGAWLMVSEWIRYRNTNERTNKSGVAIGALLAVLSTGYLLFVVKFAIPWFRSGETVHYARYFEEFGETPTEIVMTMVTSPQLLFSKLVTMAAILFCMRSFFSIGFLLRGWSQLLVGLPLLILLCLNNIAMQQPVGPYHHFHAPLIPILFWSVAASMKSKSAPSGGLSNVSLQRAKYVFSFALVSCLLFSFTPLSIRFWDPGHAMYWRQLYVPNERAKQVGNVLKQIPLGARVAATDYVHARLTHYERSYDYSDYPRAVANYEDKVPDDTEYIVLDRTHRHSIGKYDAPAQIRELVNEPEKWEVLPDQTDGFFLILRRKMNVSSESGSTEQN